jgi:hypothetical protein
MRDVSSRALEMSLLGGFVRAVSREVTLCDGGCVRCTRAAHDDGEDVDHCAWPVAADGVCEGCVFGAYEVSCLGEVIIRAIVPFPYLNLFD